MARIRVLQAVAGPEFSWTAGEEVDLPGEEAAKWADGVRAELVREASPETPEGRTAEPETTEGRKRPTRRRAPAKGDE